MGKKKADAHNKTDKEEDHEVVTVSWDYMIPKRVEAVKPTEEEYPRMLEE